MDLLSRVAGWLAENEATISAVVGITVLAGVLFAGVRWLLLRGTAGTPEKLLVRPGRRTVLIAAAAAVLMLLAGIATWLMLPAEPAREIASGEDRLLGLSPGPAVAVLPFANLTEDPQQEHFSDGLTDSITTALSRFRDVFVIARNSTLRYKGQAVDVRQLREDLGARYVVEGSVQKVEGTLRVNVQLLDAKGGTHVWAETYDRELSGADVFAIQDKITEQVVATIAGDQGVISRVRFDEIKEKPSNQLSADECVLLSRAYHLRLFGETEHATVRECLERAVKSDPSYAQAWAALCWTYLDEYRYNFNPRPNPLNRALESARKAVESDPTSQYAHEALAAAHFFRHDLDAFIAEFDQTIALNPNDAATLGSFGLLLVNLGDERGIALIRKAMSLNPHHSPGLYYGIAIHHFDRGEFKEALAAVRKAEVPGDDFWHPIFLAAIYGELGRQSDASSALEQLLGLYPGFTVGKYIEEDRKWNVPEDTIYRWAVALRKAGLPE